MEPSGEPAARRHARALLGEAERRLTDVDDRRGTGPLARLSQLSLRFCNFVEKS